MPYFHTSDWDARGGISPKFHWKRVNILQSNKKTDSLPGMQITAYRGVNDSTYTTHEWDVARE